MEKLKRYLSSLPVAEQAAYAKRAGTTIGYLRKAISKKQRMDGALCRRLDEQSNGAVPRGSLRRDIWPKERRPRNRKSKSVSAAA